MRTWLPPLILGFVLAIVAYTLMMVQIPRMLMGFATGRISQLAGYNALTATPLATDKARAIVRPSPDLAYSSCPYDVAKGPVLVDIEPVPSRYWSLSVFDARTDVKFVRNNLDAEGKPIRIAIALAGQPVPDGMQAVRVDDPTGIALLRILVEDGSQFPAIDAARKLSSCKPLS